MRLIEFLHSSLSWFFLTLKSASRQAKIKLARLCPETVRDIGGLRHDFCTSCLNLILAKKTNVRSKRKNSLV